MVESFVLNITMTVLHIKHICTLSQLKPNKDKWGISIRVHRIRILVLNLTPQEMYKLKKKRLIIKKGLLKLCRHLAVNLILPRVVELFPFHKFKSF